MFTNSDNLPLRNAEKSTIIRPTPTNIKRKTTALKWQLRQNNYTISLFHIKILKVTRIPLDIANIM